MTANLTRRRMLAAAGIGTAAAAFSGAASAQCRNDVKWDETHEIVVVGAGGAGMAAAVKAAEARAQQLKTSELNNLLAEIREGGHTRSEKGRRLKIQYCTQTGSKPPVISFWCNAPDLVDDNFERFLENRLRARFDLTGTPVRLKFRKKNEGSDK